ncbi:protein-export chaperone SecB, partial [Rickettsiales bacterium]|nr:protein-export chaperone SecB [Rickettsiales bacterium]
AAKQYIKKLSIEVPNSPDIFIKTNNKPNIEIAIDIDAKKISDLAYEVTLKIKATADQSKLFNAQIEYAGIFAFKEDSTIGDLEEVLLVQCPNLLFPFARSIMSNLTSDAGFSPLMLDPIDFLKLYNKRKEKVTVN